MGFRTMDAARLSSFDLNLLVVFDVLLGERSVTRTAARLGLSQPAVSNALSRLRDALGDPLFVRTPHGMAPTPRALALEGPLRLALDRVASALAGDGTFEPATSRRSFVLAATDYVQFALLPPLFRRIEREAPGIAVSVQPVLQRHPWQELEAGSIDLSLSAARAVPKGLHRRWLFHDRVVCVVRKDHPRARGGLTLERYLALSHIEALPIGAQGLADEVLATGGHVRRIALKVPHFLVAPHVVLTTDYVFTLAARIAGPIAKSYPLRVLPLPFEMPEIRVSAHWHERVQEDPAHRWLRQVIAEVAAALDPAE
jgi:DNA-binding transcriptional LysR family regulator